MNENSNTTIEMQIQAKSQEAIQSLNKLISGLTGVENKIKNIDTKLGNSKVDKTTSQISKLNNQTDKATNSVNKLSKALSLGGAYLSVKRLTSQMLSWMNQSIDYTEQLNLFNVVFKNIEKNGTTMYSNLGKSATQFQYKMNEAFGTNKTQTLYMQGIYQSMANNVGISDKTSALMSETMTKLTYDIASLYNKSESTVAEALRAGVYAGQTKPMRNYGVDLTQTSLQPIVNSLGITNSDGTYKQVKNMSQAEKEILRYIATLKQAQIAMGDFANTAESPANQLKVFKQQLVEAKVALTSLFIGGFSTILPYANAFLMVVKEVSKAIADMFGIKLSDYNSGIASSEDAYIDLSDSIDSATDSVKELKRQTLGFDQINNISENKDNGNDSSASGGIDQRLLDAISGYDNGMEKVRMKATEIRDKIMEWLGFTKNVNEETGEINFTYGGMKKTLKNMWDSFLGLSTVGKILVGLGLVAGTLKLWNAGKKLLTVIGGTGIVKELKNLNSYVGIYTKLSGNFIDGIVGGTNAFIKQKVVVKDAWGNIDKTKTAINGVTTAFIGMTASVTGLGFITENVKSLTNGTGNLLNVIGLVGGTILTIGGALVTVSSMATIFGTTMSTSMAIATGGISLVVAGVAGLIAYLTTSKKKTNEYEEALKELSNTAKTNADTTLSQINRTQELTNELNTLVDSNGMVKSSDEARVNYILSKVNEAYGTEYKLIDGKITKNGEEITSNNDLIKSIDQVMQKKKAESILNAYQDVYNETLKQQKTLMEEAIKVQNDSTLSTEEKTKKVKALQDQYDSNMTTIKNYEQLESDILSGNLENMQKSMKKFYDDSKESYDTAFNNIKKVSDDTKWYCKENLSGMNFSIGIDADTSKAKNSLNSFGKQLNSSGLGISFNSFSLRANGGVYSNGTWKDIQQYANGGSPTHGTMFVAGERGSEIVGDINGRTEVLNQSQIASAIYSAVVSAMSQTAGSMQQVDVRIRADKSVIVDEINQTTKQTGVCPINIPA